MNLLGDVIEAELITTSTSIVAFSCLATDPCIMNLINVVVWENSSDA